MKLSLLHLANHFHALKIPSVDFQEQRAEMFHTLTCSTTLLELEAVKYPDRFL